MITDDPLRFALTTTLRPTRSLGPLLLGGALAAGIVGAIPDRETAIRQLGDENLVFEYLRLFVRRMLSRYLGELPLQSVEPDLDGQRYSAARVLLPLIDWLHGLPQRSDSVAEFEAFDRQWRFEREWVRSSRIGSPMMEAMLILEEANRLLGLGGQAIALPYSRFPFESFEDFSESVGDQLRTVWNPHDVSIVIKAMNEGEKHMFAQMRAALVGLE